jgi:hypothetical protein
MYATKIAEKMYQCFKIPMITSRKLAGDSQNFLQKFVRFFVTLGLKILRFFMHKVLFEADIIKG